MTIKFDRLNFTTKKYKIRRLFFYLCITLLTFAGGAFTASFWFVSHQNVLPNSKVEEIKPIEIDVKQSENPSNEKTAQDCYQFGIDEPKLGTGNCIRPHEVHHRAQHSDIVGRLAEFVELFGKSKTNTFYISQVESDESRNQFGEPIHSEYVYIYWKEDKGILILYPPFSVENNIYYEWVYDMRRLDLVKGIVATEEEIGNSHYKLTKIFAKELLDKCVKHGVKVTIDKPNFKK